MKYNPITLAFPEDKEKEFRKIYFDNSISVVRLALLLAMVIYVVFGYLEYASATEYRSIINIIHFAVIIPGLALIYALSYTKIFIRTWQRLISVAFVLAALGKIILLILMPDNSAYYTGLILIYSAGYFVFRLRFIYAAIAGWTTFLCFNAAVFYFPDISFNEVITYNFFYLALNLFGMLSAYNMELYNRKNFYLNTKLDATEKEKLREQVRLANKSVEFKQNFLANMSHEIRTPLTGLVGMIDLLKKTDLDNQQIDYINTLKHSTENLHEIINQVLDYSKIEAGKVRLKKKVFQVQTLLVNAKNLFSSICDKDIEFEMVVGQEVPIYIKADKDRITQVINNLISNAVKFTNAGKIMLKVNHIASSDITKDIMLKVEVSDTGQGIKPEKLDQVFVPFAQIDEVDTRSCDGTGLGLSICKKLVEMHGGEIGFDSKYNMGSTFWFTFKAEIIDKNETSKYLFNDELPGSKKSLKILFAEDKKVNQKVISLLLESMGHEVTLANNGKDAIDKYEEDYFDLIIMDVQMPVMDGITATQKLKAKYKDIPPIVGLSANAFEGDHKKYIKLGMDDYITKPFKDEDFMEVVKKFF